LLRNVFWFEFTEPGAHLAIGSVDRWSERENEDGLYQFELASRCSGLNERTENFSRNANGRITIASGMKVREQIGNRREAREGTRIHRQ